MVRHSDTWVFNIAPENWEDCVSGPADESVHGDHVGKPWYVMRADPEDGPGLKPGDLVLARVTSADGTNPDFGVGGVWEFVDAQPVTSQDEVPWDDADYSWMLYCRPIHRKFDTTFTENFGTEPSFSGDTVQGVVQSLEEADKIDYLETLLEHVSLNDAARDRFEHELATTDIDVEANDSLDPLPDASKVWIEMTSLEGREYKQSGDYALGKAIYSPARTKDGQDRYRPMREASVGDVVLHLLQEEGAIVGASRIESGLYDDFKGLPKFDWTDEQKAEGGYLRWLRKYTEFTNPLDINADIFGKGVYTDYLDSLRDEYSHLPYDERLEFAGETGLARCPPELTNVLAAESWAIEDYLRDAGIKLSLPPEPAITTSTDSERTDFDSIKAATETVLKRLTDSKHTNVLADRLDSETVRAWSEALQGFEPTSYVPPEDRRELQELLDVLDELHPKLVTIADDLRIGTLNSADPAEVVFLAFLRDLQRQYFDGALNANQAKLNVLLSGAYNAFASPGHPLITHLRSTDATVYALTAPPSYWLTTLRYRAYGFDAADHDQWDDVETGDVLIFHAGGESNHPNLEQRDGFVFGAAIVGRKTEKPDATDWWYDEAEGNDEFPYLLTFDRLFLMPGAAELGDPPAVRTASNTDTLRAATKALERDALPIDVINDLCQDVIETDFAYRSGIDRLADDTSFGRREAVLDRLAATIHEVAPITVARDFEGMVPATAFDHLHFPDSEASTTAEELAGQITAALRAGDHIIFTGPPGTGKTEVAEAVAEYLEAEYPNLYSGYRLTTATSDWSTFDTVGGYMPDPDVDGDQLDFHPGVILNRFRKTQQSPHADGGDSDPHDSTSLQTNEPIIVDEINRANIDKAFGQLFTTLSGQRVTLPFRRSDSPDREIEVVPAKDLQGDTGSTHPSQFVVPTSWRILATMNTFDKTSLYELSYAFMRRFTFVRIGVPTIPTGGPEQEAFLKPYAQRWGLEDAVKPRMRRLVAEIWRATNTAVPERSIGPAIVEDILSYVASHDGHSDSESRLTEAVVSYIFPQLEGVPEREAIVENIGQKTSVNTDQLEYAAADMLGIHDLEWESD